MPSSTQFKYETVRKTLVRMIASGDYPPGQRLPSERQLATQLNCNYQTVRRGLAMLVDENVIDRRVGVGTFVADAARSKPNVVGTARTKPKTAKGMLGVLCCPNHEDFTSNFLKSLHEHCEMRDYRLMIHTVSDYGAHVRDVVDGMVQQGCTALLLPLPQLTFSAGDIWDFVRHVSVPVVLGRPICGLEHLCYERPEVYGRPTFMAVEQRCQYLTALGYGNLGFFAYGSPVDIAIQQSITAYSDFVSRNDMASHMGLCGPSHGYVDAIVKRWADLSGDLAVVCWGDGCAVRLMGALRKHGLRVPEDVAVTGTGDFSFAAAVSPSLTTTSSEYGYVIKAMLNHAEALMRGESAQADGSILPRLIVRESCGGRLRAGEGLEEIVAQAVNETLQGRWSNWTRDM